MGMKFETKGKKPMNIHYVNVPQPNVVEEHFGGDYHDDDFALAVVLQNQVDVLLIAINFDAVGMVI